MLTYPARRRLRAPSLPDLRAGGACPTANDVLPLCPAERPGSCSEPPWGCIGSRPLETPSFDEGEEGDNDDEDEVVFDLDEPSSRDSATVCLDVDPRFGSHSNLGNE